MGVAIGAPVRIAICIRVAVGGHVVIVAATVSPAPSRGRESRRHRQDPRCRRCRAVLLRVMENGQARSDHSPMTSSLNGLALACVVLAPTACGSGPHSPRADAGADAVSLINTIVGMAVDHRTRRPKLSNVTGGLSGPAIKPVALRMVHEACRRVAIPVIGIGGIQTAADALEFLLVGASAVQVGTANFRNPRACIEILEGIEAFLREERIAAVSDYRGTLSR
ncbi:MAG: hypothetical protein HZB63_08925 [Deltaproteobacteria bacterium]|nr:hypothetical protein [Deltaproteobacteria bacterium]